MCVCVKIERDCYRSKENEEVLIDRETILTDNCMYRWGERGVLQLMLCLVLAVTPFK